jgi:hypothetical protein
VRTSGPKWFVKTENAQDGVWLVKADIRRRILAALTPPKTVVFDAFCGEGLMFAEVWREAAGYVGCDQQWFKDDRVCFVSDNHRVLRAIDLQPFTCFDLDSYGSPWEQALIIATRRRVQVGEQLGFALTDGSGINTRLGGIPTAIGVLGGLNRSAGFAGVNHDDLIDRVVHGLVRRMGCRIVSQWRALGTTGSGMRYLGLVVEGVGYART